jgi:integrase
VGSLFDEMQRSLVLKDIRAGTRRSYLCSLKPFEQMDMETLTVSSLNEVLNVIGNQNTRRKTVIALKSLVDHPAVKTLRVPAAISKVYDLPDETTLRLALMTCTHETRALLMAYAGLRCGEACAVTSASLEGRWLMVDKQVDELTRNLVPVKTTAARVPLPLWLVPHVEGLSEPVNPKAVRKSLARAGTRVGIHLNPHQLRHWYATTLVRQGVPPNVVQRLMRHADIRVTFRVYAQVSQGDLTSVVDELGLFR